MDFGKLGFGFLRLPHVDPNDPADVDLETTKKWWICISSGGSGILIRPIPISMAKAKKPCGWHWCSGIRGRLL